MCSRDYTKEVGLSSGEVKVPLRFAVPILVILAAAAWYGMSAGLAEYNAKQHAAPTAQSGSGAKASAD